MGFIQTWCWKIRDVDVSLVFVQAGKSVGCGQGRPRSDLDQSGMGHFWDRCRVVVSLRGFVE